MDAAAIKAAAAAAIKTAAAAAIKTAAAATIKAAAAAAAANCTRYFKSDDEHKREVYANLGKDLTRCSGTTVIYDKSKCYRRQCRATVRNDIETYESKLSSQKIVDLLTKETMELKQTDADIIFGEKTYFICFRHKQELSKIPYPYIQKAAKDETGISIVTNLQGILDTIETFKWAVQEEDVALDEMLKILKTRMEVISDNFKASSESMTLRQTIKRR